MEYESTGYETQEVQQEQPQEQFDSAANTEEVAQPQQEQVTQTQAFSRRLNEERERIEQEIRQQYEGQFSPYKSFVETEAQKYNMSPEQYLQAIEQQRQEQERQQYLDRGVDPDLIQKLVAETPEVKWAREQRQKAEQEQAFQSEARELFEAFPDLQPADIPDEVWKAHEQGVPLKYAYMEIAYKNASQQAEQRAIQKMQQAQRGSVGSLSQGDVSHDASITKMNKKDFNSLIQKVKAGEVRDF